MEGWLGRSGTGRWWRGAQGVKAGWRAALYVVLLMLVVAGEIWGLARLHPPWLKPQAALSADFVMLNELFLLMPVLAATAVMARMEKRSVVSCGLEGRHVWRLLLKGLGVGIAALSLLEGLLLVSGHASLRWQGEGVHQIALSGFGWLAACLLTGLTEELAFRGYIQQALTRGMGFWPAACATSLIFGGLHVTNQHESVIGILNVCGAGLIFCLGLWRTGTLWWSIGFHAGWDFSENFLFGTHDSGQSCAGALLDTLPHGAAWFSGGLTGPEGSLLGLGVECLVAGWLLLFLHRSPASFDMDQCGPKG
ncbi:lysostaphin resistance A-like protein [Acidocella sp.]|uniref:CPBP family intramembrane glutamic endopeptidase n=1 Tax=Acidocella sp. TaxID=50710 RepID=UPI003CFF633A